jgi:transposase
MKNVLKQVVGIDVAQKELVVYLGSLNEELSVSMIGYKTFPNIEKGFISLVEWVDKRKDISQPVRFVMEATGVYHESLAYFLDAQSLAVSIVLPNKIANYFKTLEVKTVTDKTAAETICRFGLERKLELWKRPEKAFKTMKQLTRERDQIVEERTIAKNQLHAEQSEAEPHSRSIERTKQRILFLDSQEKEIKQELLQLIKKDKAAKELIPLLCSIPGVGLLTAITVLAETNKFELIRNKRQLTSYAGLDVKEKESGTSIKGQPKISKRGNKYLRKAMHLPALAAIRHDDRFKAIFARLVAKHGVKMKAVVAVQRKLLEMIFTMYRTKVPYDKDYLKSNEETAVTKGNSIKN